jgi:hypothetical protein
MANLCFGDTAVLKQEVAQLRTHCILQLKRCQPQHQLGHATLDTAIPVVGGIPRTVSLLAGALGLVLLKSQNRLVVSKILENAPMNGKISPGDIIFAVCGVDMHSMQLCKFESKMHFVSCHSEQLLPRQS